MRPRLLLLLLPLPAYTPLLPRRRTGASHKLPPNKPHPRKLIRPREMVLPRALAVTLARAQQIIVRLLLRRREHTEELDPAASVVAASVRTVDTQAERRRGSAAAQASRPALPAASSPESRSARCWLLS